MKCKADLSNGSRVTVAGWADLKQGVSENLNFKDPALIYV